MREILFRGKDIVGNWYAGNLAVIKQDFHNGAGTIKAGSYISNECGSPFAYRIRPETVGQFTGLLDKNGKKIFEGDVVFAGYGEYYQGTHEHSTTITVDMSNYDALNALCNANVVEVIGNIHK